MITALIYVFIVCCIVGIILWGIQQIPGLPQIVKVVLTVLVALILLLWLLQWLGPPHFPQLK